MVSARRGKWLFIGVFFAFASLSFAEGIPCHARVVAEAPKSSADYWREVGLTFPVLASHLTDENCYRSLLSLRMCAAAVDTLLRFSREPLRLLPGARPELPGYVAATRFRVGPFHVVRFDPNAPPPPRLEATIEEAWQRLLDDPGKRPRFTSLVEWVRKTFVPPDLEMLAVPVALNAYFAVRDPHTYIVPLRLLSDMEKGDSSTAVGIGAVLILLEGRAALVQHVVEGGPAAEGGVRHGDILTHVAEEDVAEVGVVRAHALLRGEAGSRLPITIRRKDASHELVLTRNPYAEKNVSARIYDSHGHRLGHLRIGSFLIESTGNDVKAALSRLERDGAQGLVLDLRGNEGGLLSETKKVAGLFLGKGKLVAVERSVLERPAPDDFHYTSTDAATRLPMVVLIDGVSASGSELLAGALQDYGRAVIAGVRSYGKGTVQRLHELDRPNSPFQGFDVGLYATIARFHLPSGRTNQLLGIQPDFPVYQSPELDVSEIRELREENLGNALPHTGPAYVPRNAARIARLRLCIEGRGNARRAFLEWRSDPLPRDYQLLYAADIMACLKKETAFPKGR